MVVVVSRDRHPQAHEQGLLSAPSGTRLTPIYRTDFGNIGEFSRAVKVFSQAK